MVAATALDHGHIYGQCNGLAEAGAEIRYVYDPDPEKVNAFRERYPAVQVLDSEQALLDKEDVHMVAAAAITNRRGPLGVRVMQHGKDYFTDKAPFTTLDQLADAKQAVAETGKKYMVYYSERLHVEGAVHAENLIADGAIGDVVQVIGLGPHRLSAATRPDWFFDFEQYGGILCDIGSHQIEQFLFYAGAKDATVNASRVGNYNNPEYPELEDFGDAMLTADNGVSNYFRVDWFTPDGLGSWGDGRLQIVGTTGTIEVRKYLDLARDAEGDQVYLVNSEGEFRMPVHGQVGFPFFGRLILDSLNRTENAMTQDHAFKAAELCLIAQRDAIRAR